MKGFLVPHRRELFCCMVFRRKALTGKPAAWYNFDGYNFTKCKFSEIKGRQKRPCSITTGFSARNFAVSGRLKIRTNSYYADLIAGV